MGGVSKALRMLRHTMFPRRVLSAPFTPIPEDNLRKDPQVPR